MIVRVGAVLVAALVLAGSAAAACAHPKTSLTSLEGQVMLYLLVVLIVALVGGVIVAVLTAVAAALLINFYFVSPVHTFDVVALPETEMSDPPSRPLSFTFRKSGAETPGIRSASCRKLRPFNGSSRTCSPLTRFLSANASA